MHSFEIFYQCHFAFFRRFHLSHFSHNCKYTHRKCIIHDDQLSTFFILFLFFFIAFEFRIDDPWTGPNKHEHRIESTYWPYIFHVTSLHLPCHHIISILTLLLLLLSSIHSLNFISFFFYFCHSQAHCQARLEYSSNILLSHFTESNANRLARYFSSALYCSPSTWKEIKARSMDSCDLEVKISILWTRLSLLRILFTVKHYYFIT